MEQPLDHPTVPALVDSSRARDHGGTRFPGIIWALVTVGTAITAWYVGAPADHPAHRLVDNALFTFMPALAALLCFGAASRSSRSAQSWRLIGFACVAWLAGQLVWNAYEIVLLQSPPFPSLADVGYILFYPLCAAGLIQLIRDASLERGAEVMLDGLIISAVAALLSFEVLLVPSLDTGLTDPVVTLASVIWQVGIVGLVILGTLAFIMHGRSSQRWPVGALLAGLLSFAIADLVYGQAAYEGSYSVGSPLDLSWHFGFLFVGLGAVLAGRQADNGPQREQLVGVGWRQAGSIISVLAFGGLAAYAALDRTSHVLLAIGSAAVAIALALRFAYSGQQAQRLARRTRERDRLSAEVAAREATQTEMAVALAAQRTAYRELERLNRTKSEFVTVVSHEFRTPLTSIQGFADLIRDEDLTEDEVKDFAGIVGENARRLARLIDDMLDIDRLESGQVKCDHQTLELNAIVTDVADSLRATSQHRIELKLAPQLPMVHGDKDQLIRVATNLIANAIKYTPDRGVISVTTAASTGAVHLTVRDSGIGIPADALETIFERFVRAVPADHRFRGTGLGLSITRKLVELHGGQVWAESQIGEGSTFHVLLPLSNSSPSEQ